MKFCVGPFIEADALSEWCPAHNQQVNPKPKPQPHLPLRTPVPHVILILNPKKT